MLIFFRNTIILIDYFVRQSPSNDVVDSMKELRLRISSENSELDNPSHDEKSVFSSTSPVKLCELST